MAIFKRGKKVEPVPPSTPPAPPTGPTMSQADVAKAEQKVKDLLGQHAEAEAATAAVPASSPTEGKSDSIFGAGGAASDAAPLELHDESHEEAAETGAKPAIEPDHPLSTLAPEEDSPSATDDDSDEGSSNSIPISDSQDVAMEDVDREVNDLINKLDSEASKLDSDISSKNEQIKSLQVEIDEANNKKAELDKKINGLRQVVDASK